MLDEHREEAASTLRAHCVRLARQQFYNQKHTSANQFTYEKTGKRAKKADNVKTAKTMTKEDYISVTKLSMKFYIATKLPLHYLFLNCIFRLSPTGPSAKPTHGRCWFPGGSVKTPSLPS